jgi:effector-binding domain-containing protein
MPEMAYEVEIERIPKQACVCLGGRGPVAELRARAARLDAVLESAGAASEGPLMARFFDGDDYDPADADFEVCRALAPDAGGRTPDRIGELATVLIPAHHAMVVRHRGPYGGLGAAHDAVSAELESVGYRRAGPIAEVFIEGPGPGRAPADYLTEVRYPFAR